jgi:hypothetical protein
VKTALGKMPRFLVVRKCTTASARPRTPTTIKAIAAGFWTETAEHQTRGVSESGAPPWDLRSSSSRNQLTAMVCCLRESDDDARQRNDHQGPPDPVERLDKLRPRRPLLVLNLEIEEEDHESEAARRQINEEAVPPACTVRDQTAQERAEDGRDAPDSPERALQTEGTAAVSLGSVKRKER